MSAPVMGMTSAGTELHVHHSELEVFFLVRHLLICRDHPQKPRLSSFIKIAVFENCVCGTWRQAADDLGACSISTPLIGSTLACTVYLGNTGCLDKNLHLHKSRGFRLYSAPQPHRTAGSHSSGCLLLICRRTLLDRRYTLGQKGHPRMSLSFACTEDLQCRCNVHRSEKGCPPQPTHIHLPFS